MNDLLHGKISGSVALKKGLLSLVTGDEGVGQVRQGLGDFRKTVAQSIPAPAVTVTVQ
jgi:hypothetical protein